MTTPENAVSFEYKPENKNISIVLVGNFNPIMFQPQWFEVNQVIGKPEIDAVIANKNQCIVAPNITVFNTSQLQIRVDDNRFQTTAIKESFDIVKDVVKKTFERLSAIPIRAMGINISSHFKMPDRAKYQKFADRISPKDIWKDLLGDNVSGDNRTGGLLRMQMVNNKEDNSGNFNVIVEPSVKFRPGIFISCNDHYQFEENTDAETAMIKLEDNFETSQKKSADIQMSLFKGL